MATRREIQIAQDLIKCSNIMNDLLDAASYNFQGINADTGEELTIQIAGSDPLSPGTEHPATIDDRQMRGKRLCQSALVYRRAINDFVKKIDEGAVTNGLGAFGMTTLDFLADVTEMETACQHILSFVGAAIGAEKLEELATHINNNVEKLPLIRRTWQLGV